MQQPLTLCFFAIFVVHFMNLLGETSAQPKCANPNCDAVIAEGIATQNYLPVEDGFISLKHNDKVKIYMKEAGKNRDILWVKVMEKGGFIKKQFIREQRVFTSSDQLISVPNEFGPAPAQRASGGDPAGGSLSQGTPKAPREDSTQEALAESPLEMQGFQNKDSQITVPEVTHEIIPIQGTPHQASNPAPTHGGLHKFPSLGQHNPSPAPGGVPYKDLPPGVLNPALSLKGSPKASGGSPELILDSHIPPTLGGLGGEGAEVGVIQGLVKAGTYAASHLEGASLRTQQESPKVGDNEDEGNGNEGEENGSEVSPQDSIPLHLSKGAGEVTPLTTDPTFGLGITNSPSFKEVPHSLGNGPVSPVEQAFRESPSVIRNNPQPHIVKPGFHESIKPSPGGQLPIVEVPKENTPIEKAAPKLSAIEKTTPGISLENTDTEIFSTENFTAGIATAENTSPGIASMKISENTTPGIATMKISKNTTPEIATTENTTSEIATTENTTPEKAITEKTTSEIPTSENISPEIPTTNIAPEIPTTDNITPEIPTIENITPEIPTTENITPEIPIIGNIAPEIPTTENIALEIPTTENIIPEIPTTENITPKIPTTENIASKIHITENIAPEIPTTENITPEIARNKISKNTTTSEIATTENNTLEIATMEISENITHEKSTENTTLKISSIENSPLEISSIENTNPEMSTAERESEAVVEKLTSEESSMENPTRKIFDPDVSSLENTPEYPTVSTIIYNDFPDLSYHEDTVSEDSVMNPTLSDDYPAENPFLELSSTGIISEDIHSEASFPSEDISSMGASSENTHSEDSFPTEQHSEVLNESDNGTASGGGVMSAVFLLLNEEMTLALKMVFAQHNISAGTLTLLLVMSGTLFLLYISHMVVVKRSRESPLLRTLNQLDREYRILTQEYTAFKQQMAASNGQIKSLSGVSTPKIEEVKQCYEEQQGRLKEELCTAHARNQQLQGDVEVLTANQDELHRMLNELLADQRERSSFEESVNSLQQMLDDQREVVESLTSDLALKTRLNEELRSEVKNGKAKMNKLDYQIEQLSRSLEEATTAKQGLGSRLAREEASVADLRAVNDALRLEMDLLIGEAETRASEETRLGQVAKELKQSLTLKEAECQVSRECLKKLQLLSSCSGNDIEARLQEVFQTVQTKARLVASEEELEGLRAELEEVRGRERSSSAQVDTLEQKAETAQGEVERLQKDRDAALAKLDVLTHHFEEKETQLKKELECQGGLLQDAEGSASLISNRIRSYEVELSSSRSQIAGLRAEIEEQKESHKLTLTKEEKKGHDNWMAARAAERRQEELRQENAQLRQKLIQLQKDSEHHSLLLKAQSKRSNTNGSLSSPTPMEGELSPLDMDGGLPPLPMMPPFPSGRPPLPPRGLLPGLPPPPPHLFGPPLPPPPPDRRLPPAGRMASPQGYDRYSPPDSDYFDYSPAGRGSDGPPPRRYTKGDRRSPSPGGERRSPARWFTHSPPLPHGFPKQRRSPQGPEGNLYDSDSPRGGINPSKGKKTSTPIGASDR